MYAIRSYYAFEQLQWMSVLKSLTAYQMYRQQVRTRVRGKDAIRFIMLDETSYNFV